MRDLEARRNRRHAFPFPHQGGDKGVSQACTGQGDAVDDAAQEPEDAWPTRSAERCLQWHSRHAVAPHSGQLGKKILFVVDVVLDSAGNVVDCFDYGVGRQKVTPFVARRLVVGYLLTSEGATASRLAHIVAATGGCGPKELGVSLAMGWGVGAS
jgi:hypothetical protein